MLLHVDTTGELPIYEQIVRQVKFGVAAGAIGVGEHVPSVRELAGQLAINPNTVARAYRELQHEGILTAIRGTGMAVSPEAPRLCRTARTQLVKERLQNVLEEAVQSGLEPQEIHDLIDRVLKRLTE